MSLNTLVKGLASRVLPQAVPDNNEQEVRTSRYGSLIVEPIYPDFSGLVDEGSYYVVQASAVAGHILTAFDATKPFFLLQNADANPAATTGKRIFLDFIRYQVTTAPASGTNAKYQLNIDQAVRWSSAGTLQTPVNVNSGVSSLSISKPYLGLPIAAAASANGRLLDAGTTRTVIPAVGDIMIFNFGGVEKVVPRPQSARRGRRSSAIACRPRVLILATACCSRCSSRPTPRPRNRRTGPSATGSGDVSRNELEGRPDGLDTLLAQ